MQSGPGPDDDKGEDEGDVAAHGPRPVLPDYSGPCITNIIPALLDWSESPEWLPAPARGVDQVVLLVLDGLGWLQLHDRRDLAPHLCSMAGGPITTIAPSTTAAALTSISTGLPPGEHGLVGYRLWTDSDVLNVLRWSTARGDARRLHVPARLQPHAPFAGQRPPVITRAEFVDTGFTQAHLAGTRFHGYRMTSTLVNHVAELTRRGEPFVYAYYEGVDKVAHEFGLGTFYDAELRAADRLVAELCEVLPAGCALVVTADHGQLETGDDVVALHPAVLAQTAAQSGEGRFRWLHARPGRARALHEAALEHHRHQAWVRDRAQVVDDGWLGPKVTDEAAARLGDVALAAQGRRAFFDPADTGPFSLVGRHGSLTPEEMWVPLLAAAG
jgi:predicted AlkP superfamily pyrophosphatase or phosphodiesterase